VVAAGGSSAVGITKISLTSLIVQPFQL